MFIQAHVGGGRWVSTTSPLTIGQDRSCDVPTGHYIDLQPWIGSGHVPGGQPKFPPHNVAALGDRSGFVESNLAVAALTAEAAIAR